MSFFKDVSFIGAIKDLRIFMQQSPKERVIPGLMALLIPSIFVFLFVIDASYIERPIEPQQIIYFENFAADRTDEEILADRWAIQCIKDKLEAQRVANVKALGRATGVDVDKMEKEIAERRAARGEKEVQRPDNVTC